MIFYVIFPDSAEDIGSLMSGHWQRLKLINEEDLKQKPKTVTIPQLSFPHFLFG